MSKNFSDRKIKTALAVFGLLILLVGAAPFWGLGKSTSDLERELQAQIEQLQREIAGYRSQIQSLYAQSESFKRDIQLFEAQIAKIQLQIKAVQLEIENNNRSISRLDKKIGSLDKKLQEKRQILSAYLRELYRQQKKSLVEFLFSQKDVSSFLASLQALENLQVKMQEDIASIKIIKARLENDKKLVEEERENNLRLKSIQQLQRGSLERKIAQKEYLIAQSRSRASILERRKKTSERAIEEIRNRLYILKGTTGSMDLSKAYSLASKVARKLDLNPAFIMAVLKRESDWGYNIGGGNWRQDMKPADREAFLKITKELGINPDLMPVSSKPRYGWGGAMGPAQFLPRTWLEYKERISKITGHNPPSPWNLEDAFAAAAIKLQNAGAGARTYDAEWKAAMIYFAGRRWNNPAYSFYGDSVMELKQAIEREIARM